MTVSYKICGHWRVFIKIGSHPVIRQCIRFVALGSIISVRVSDRQMVGMIYFRLQNGNYCGISTVDGVILSNFCFILSKNDHICAVATDRVCDQNRDCVLWCLCLCLQTKWYFAVRLHSTKLLCQPFCVIGPTVTFAELSRDCDQIHIP